MLILAHRGWHIEAPENTMEAFRRAIAAGADGIETDIRLACDGEPILFHNRFGPNGQAVDGLSREDLSRLVGYQVPSLAEAVGENSDILWNFEIKTLAAVEPTIALLAPLSSRRRILVTSFIHPVVYKMVSRLNVEGGLLLAHDPEEPLRAGMLQFQCYPRLRSVVFDFETVRPEIVREATECGLHVYMYNLTTEDDHREARAYSPYGIITDHIEYLLNRS